MRIRMTNPRRPHTHQHLTRPNLRYRNLTKLKRLPNLHHLHCFHRSQREGRVDLRWWRRAVGEIERDGDLELRSQRRSAPLSTVANRPPEDDRQQQCHHNCSEEGGCDFERGFHVPLERSSARLTRADSSSGLNGFGM